MQRRLSGLEPGLATVIALAATVAPVQPVRAAGVVALTCFLPGWVVVRGIGLDRLGEVLLAIALSLAATAAVSMCLLYASRWSWQASVVVLGATTLCWAIARTVGGRARWRSQVR